MTMQDKLPTTHYNTDPKGGVSCSKESIRG
jgi:hypothetical protein